MKRAFKDIDPEQFKEEIKREVYSDGKILGVLGNIALSINSLLNVFQVERLRTTTATIITPEDGNDYQLEPWAKTLIVDNNHEAVNVGAIYIEYEDGFREYVDHAWENRCISCEGHKFFRVRTVDPGGNPAESPVYVRQINKSIMTNI